MQYVYGPIPSRRLGQSLGIDPIPLKTCNWNCVYCQLGRSTPLVNVRQEYVPVEVLLAEVAATLATHSPGSIDWISIVGSGEPTLHSGLGRIIGAIKQLSRLPLAVITNGTLLHLPEVRQDLLAANAVLPTLSAGNAALHRRIHRAHPECSFEQHLQGLIAFRQQYRGKLWLEVMLIRGLNDRADELRELAAAIQQVGPDAVQITLPLRPPAEPWVEPADEAGIQLAVQILGAHAEVMHPAHGSFDLSGCETLADAVIAIITRHPMRQDELEQALADYPAEAVQATLRELQQNGHVQQIVRDGALFWSVVRQAASHRLRNE